MPEPQQQGAVHVIFERMTFAQTAAGGEPTIGWFVRDIALGQPARRGQISEPSIWRGAR